MLRLAVLLTSTLFGSFALADRYGIGEFRDELGTTPTWLIPSLLVALLIYHLHRETKLSSETSDARRWSSELSNRLVQTERQLTELRSEFVELQQEHDTFCRQVLAHLNDESTDDEYIDQMEDFFSRRRD